MSIEERIENLEKEVKELKLKIFKSNVNESDLLFNDTIVYHFNNLNDTKDSVISSSDYNIDYISDAVVSNHKFDDVPPYPNILSSWN